MSAEDYMPVREIVASCASRLHHLHPGDNTTREVLTEFDRSIAEHDAKVREEERARVLTEIRWLMDARNEYSDERVHEHMHVVEHLLRVLEGAPYSAEDWLPSWRWDAWDALREGAKTDG